MDHLTTEEIELVLIHMDQRPGIFFSILAYAGLRKGEALALKRKNLDFDSKEIRVTNSWSAANRYFEPKTEAAKRRVPMLPILETALRDYCDEQRFEPEDFLFRSPRSKEGWPVINPFRMQLNKALAACGLRHVIVHSFRHYFASLMIASSASIVALSKVMGHKRVTVTLDRYGHLYPQDLVNAVDKANALIEAVRMDQGE